MFQIPCPAKGCKSVEPFIDPKTDKVYCSSCNTEITNVTYFAKVQMKTLKQFKVKNNTSFSVKCQSCSHESRPIIISNKLVCPSCKKPHQHLSHPFTLILKDFLKNPQE